MDTILYSYNGVILRITLTFIFDDKVKMVNEVLVDPLQVNGVHDTRECDLVYGKSSAPYGIMASRYEIGFTKSGSE